ncbi:MAG: acyltransferase, wsdgatmgat subfamily protein, partial [Frankiales bacterium]|nr:acyltransferase, wsdgatmgat subfamily protein [Frankiales bacterium]
MAAIERLAERELGAMETLFRMGDSEVVTRSSIAVLIRLVRPPDYEAVVRVHERASRLVPHLRSKVVAPVLPVSRPYWVIDPDFDVRYHVRHARLPGDGSEADLMQFVEVWGSVPVDPARPLWEVTVVDGLADGSGALLFKLHHALSDGKGIQEIWSNVFDLAPGVSAGELPLMPAAEDVTGLDLTRQKLNQLPFELGHQGVGGVRSAVGIARRAISSPRHTVSSVADYASSLRRTLATTPAAASPLLGRRGARRAFLALTVPLADLRRSAKEMGTSVNDAYVAAVLGGLARYHDLHDCAADELLLALPVSVRREADKVEQNRFVGVQVAGPLCGFAPAERARLVRERVRAARDEPALEAFLKVAPMVSRLPLWLTTAALGSSSTPADAQLSNIPAWPETAYLCGVEVTGFFGFGPLAGAAMMVVMTSQGGRCDVAINVDHD